MSAAPARPVAFLSGPTASGKSALAIALAKEHGLAIISADSMQVYRGVEIGTAQPTESEREGVPHELLGVAEPGAEYHAARFMAEAYAAMARHAATGRRSLVVGGTGLWIRALRQGLFDGPSRDESIRARLRELLAAHGVEALYAHLQQIDPEGARSLMPRDHIRILRAIEVFELSGRSIVDWHREDEARRAAMGPLPPILLLDGPRDAHEKRIRKRVDAMLELGWLEEARRLRALGLPEHAPPMKALGYPELFRVLDGAWSLDEARERIAISTRQYARRQRKWYRAEVSVVHVDVEGSRAGIEDALRG